MAKKLIAVVKPPKPLAEMSEEEARTYAERLYDERLAPAAATAGVKVEPPGRASR